MPMIVHAVALALACLATSRGLRAQLPNERWSVQRAGLEHARSDGVVPVADPLRVFSTLLLALNSPAAWQIGGAGSSMMGRHQPVGRRQSRFGHISMRGPRSGKDIGDGLKMYTIPAADDTKGARKSKTRTATAERPREGRPRERQPREGRFRERQFRDQPRERQPREAVSPQSRTRVIRPLYDLDEDTKPAREVITDTYWPCPLPPELFARLKENGYERPMPVQNQSIPYVLQGSNVVLHSATGSGKTLAFLVPLVVQLEPTDRLRAIIAVPSQELAVQIAAEAEKLLPPRQNDAGGLIPRVLLAISSSREIELEQQDKLFGASSVPQILVGTPQRLADLTRSDRARPLLKDLRTLVYDEVDAMLPPLPKELIEKLAEQNRERRDGPLTFADRQPGQSPFEFSTERRLLNKKPAEVLYDNIMAVRPSNSLRLQVISASATATSEMRKQLATMLGGRSYKYAGVVVTAAPAHPSPKKLKKFGIAGIKMPSTIRHSAYVGRDPEALNQVLQLAFQEYLPQAPLLVLPNGQSIPKKVEELKFLGFEGAISLTDALGVDAADPEYEDYDDGIRARRRPGKGETLQSEIVKKRKQLAESFAKRMSVPLIVTTEHSARGMDFKNIDAVFMVGLPQRIESYIHVAGRTAREGRKGRAVVLLTETELDRLDKFGRSLGIKIETIDVRFWRV